LLIDVFSSAWGKAWVFVLSRAAQSCQDAFRPTKKGADLFCETQRGRFVGFARCINKSVPFFCFFWLHLLGRVFIRAFEQMVLFLGLSRQLDILVSCEMER